MGYASSQTVATPPDSGPRTEVVDLSIIIVNYNVLEFLAQALRSIDRARADFVVEVFVVDNNSVDGSVEMVRTQFPWVRLLANDRNVGFSRANNQAIREARGRYLLILNPDTIVQEDTFGVLLDFMERHPQAGAVGCKILNPDGTFAPESRRAFPRPSVAFYRLVGLSRLFPRSPVFGRYNMTFLPRDREAEVDALSGSCMLVRHEALYRSYGTPPSEDATDGAGGGAGLLDEDFFMYGEDLDWCYRIQQAGWKIYYTPETQIIHYKGESTKKGELRYVRLFYGAMLRFTEKHFQTRYSRLFAHALRLGIFTRAAITLAANALHRIASPLTDFSLVYAVVAGLGVAVSLAHGTRPSPLYFAAVAPAYALGAMLGIGAAGGYRASGRRRLRPAWAGAVAGLLVVAAASFFVKEIAFSRFLVLLSFPLILLPLLLRRIAGREVAEGRARRAVLVGRVEEARRLQEMLDRHPAPPFSLIGYVPPQSRPRADGPPRAEALPRLGALHQLRDLVRLRHLDDVIFAPDGLSHSVIFHHMQGMRDLPVQFRILAEGHTHVIGKASVDDLTLPPLVEAEAALGRPRSTAARRAFELPVALLGLLLHPFARLLARSGAADGPAARLAARTRRAPEVLAGRRRLVGYLETDAYRPPEEWDLEPGLFAITETLPGADAAECCRAYSFYAGNQSAALDWDIIVRTLSRMGGAAHPAERHIHSDK